MLDLELILPATSLGISRLTDEPGHLTLPIEKNKNDKGTVFAGSIFSLAALSGYDTAFEKRAERGLSGDLFLLSSRITYHSPALNDIAAKSLILEDLVLTKKGNFKISVRVEIFDRYEGRLHAVFEGAYVIKAGEP